MPVDIEFEIDEQSIMRVVLTGVWGEKQSQTKLISHMVNQAILYKAVGIFIRNEVKTTIDQMSSFLVSRALSPESGLICIANYRLHIPEPGAVNTLSIQSRVSKEKGVPIKTFYDEQEAEDWMESQIKGEVGNTF